jgi:3-deoxy-manno-octulosonate cytidylyltransferase (CMP-KDO synthetase)
VVVAADHESIVDACERHDVQVVLTRADHPSGSDRLAEACDLLALHGDEIVVNVQGDEPLIDPALIDSVAALLRSKPGAQMSTAAHAIHDVADVANTNVVKVVLDAQGMALYFSRATIPWSRDAFAAGAHSLPPLPLLRHVGIYGYRAAFLRGFPRMPQSPIEVAEALEQLRALWHGHRIAVHVTEKAPGIGVDTPADLERVRALFSS